MTPKEFKKLLAEQRLLKQLEDDLAPLLKANRLRREEEVARYQSIISRYIRPFRWPVNFPTVL